MKQRLGSLEEMKFETMDVRELPTAEKFDIILDKALLDSILCGGESRANAEKMLDHVSRALSPGGYYICISHGQSTTRMPVLQNDEYAWTIETREIGMIAHPCSSSSSLNGVTAHCDGICL
jgi:EEF1A lysine methyltransferase 4